MTWSDLLKKEVAWKGRGKQTEPREKSFRKDREKKKRISTKT